MKRILTIFFLSMTVATQAETEFVSPWVRSIEMPASSRQKIEKRVANYSKRRGYDAAMRRMAHLKPAVDDFCQREGIDPEPIYGLILTESQARPCAVDYVFRAGKSRKAHIGLGQLNYERLPSGTVSKRAKLALRWQKTKSNADFEAWKKLDKRFDPRWNLKTTIREFHGHLERTGDETLAFMGHHGGGNDPVKAVKLYAKDHGAKLSRRWVAAYVAKHRLSYFDLYEHKGSARKYWAEKSDGHLTYAFAPVVWSELFARWCKENKTIIVVRDSRKSEKEVASISQTKNRKVKKMNTIIEILRNALNFCSHLMHPETIFSSVSHSLRLFVPYWSSTLTALGGFLLWGLVGQIFIWLLKPGWKLAAKRIRLIMVIDKGLVFASRIIVVLAGLTRKIWFTGEKLNQKDATC